jgi:fructose-bisphosphate aldolase, class I
LVSKFINRYWSTNIKKEFGMKYREELIETANLMVVAGKGILAADESSPTCGKRFDQINLKSSENSRRRYRNMLFTTPHLEDYISGVILFDETIRQSTFDGIPFPKYLISKGILPGIKVDSGAKELALHENEKVTEGLDGLRDRLIEYRKLGAKFAKWRAVITIGEGIPTDACIDANAHGLARYASLCQEQGIVPIVEPEVLMDGTHSIKTCFEVTERAQKALFKHLEIQNVLLEGIILKPSMVISGSDCANQADIDLVASETVRCLKNNVPKNVPGIAFLSGGQSDELATTHLNRMNEQFKSELPWKLTFSYGRALQHPVIMAWHGNDENEENAQKILHFRAKCNGLASKGEYSKHLNMEMA